MALKIFQCKDSDICDLVSFIFTPDGIRGQHFHNPQILNSGSIFQETFRPPTHLEKECNQFFFAQQFVSDGYFSSRASAVKF